MGPLLLAASEPGKSYVLPKASATMQQPNGRASGQASDIANHARKIMRVTLVLLNLSTFNATNNTNAFIQIVYNGGNSPLYLYVCVVLVTSVPGFNQTKFFNDNSSTSSIPVTTNSSSLTRGASTSVALTIKVTATTATAMITSVTLVL
ncbi:hypothetical protein BGZ49_007890 [Haplosporangium sp. Z 27]|nr:hypothetical protein BGZ49_007890 [Haplosporangium sp. Z 27]